jgi:conjugative transposon TraN protein
MKQLFALTALLTITAAYRASAQFTQQELPPSTVVRHYHITVSWNTTTVLVFPAPIKPIDRGDADIRAAKQPGVDNVLKLKAARRNFPTTNLHVFTTDGKLYAFDVSYSDSLASTWDLTALAVAHGNPYPEPLILLSNQLLNSGAICRAVQAMDSLRSSHAIATERRERMSLRLDIVGQSGPLLLFRFHIANHSNLDYPLAFVRLYVRDHQKAKRTSIQEQEVQPVYQDSVTSIPGKAAVTDVVAVPAFTLAGGKELIVEVYEKNGGRSLRLRLHNHILFNTRKL